MKYIYKKGFINKKIAGKTIIYDNESSFIHELNRTTVEILNLLKKGNDEKEIIGFLSKKYQVNKKTITTDVKNIISSLIKKKIIFPSRNK